MNTRSNAYTRRGIEKRFDLGLVWLEAVVADARRLA